MKKSSRYVVRLLASLLALLPTGATAQTLTLSPAAVTATPGQQITLTVISSSPVGDPSLRFENPLGSFTVAGTSGSATTFLVTIGSSVPAGKYAVRAVDRISNVLVVSEAVHVTVDLPSEPLRLEVFPPEIDFRYPGQRLPVQVFAYTAGPQPIEVTDSATLQVRIVKSALLGVTGPRTEAPPSGGGVASDIAAFQDGQVLANAPGNALAIFSYKGAVTTLPISVPLGMRGDLNGDRKVDQTDLNILLSVLGRTTSGPDARDLNGDRRLDALDTRILTTLCTRPRCAIE